MTVEQQVKAELTRLARKAGRYALWSLLFAVLSGGVALFSLHGARTQNAQAAALPRGGGGGGGGGGLADIVDDTTPQLGGDLDANGSAFTDVTDAQLEFEDDICVDDDADGKCEVVTAAGVMSLDPDDDSDKQIVLTTSSGAGNIQVCNATGTCSMNILSGISSTDQVKSTAGDLWIYSTPASGDIRLLASGSGGTIQLDSAAGIVFDPDNDSNDEAALSSVGRLTVDILNVPSGASPPATCTVGDMFWDTDETDDTVITTTNDNALLFCGATDTWSIRIDS